MVKDGIAFVLFVVHEYFTSLKSIYYHPKLNALEMQKISYDNKFLLRDLFAEVKKPPQVQYPIKNNLFDTIQ